MSQGGKCREKNGHNNGALKNKYQKKKISRSNIKVIKRSNTVSQALNLLTMCNMNPRSVYNKVNEFHDFVKEEDVDLLFASALTESEPSLEFAFLLLS